MNVVIYPYSIEHSYIKSIKNYLDTILSILCVMVIFYR